MESVEAVEEVVESVEAVDDVEDVVEAVDAVDDVVLIVLAVDDVVVIVVVVVVVVQNLVPSGQLILYSILSNITWPPLSDLSAAQNLTPIILAALVLKSWVLINCHPLSS